MSDLPITPKVGGPVPPPTTPVSSTTASPITAAAPSIPIPATILGAVAKFATLKATNINLSSEAQGILGRESLIPREPGSPRQLDVG